MSNFILGALSVVWFDFFIGFFYSKFILKEDLRTAILKNYCLMHRICSFLAYIVQKLIIAYQFVRLMFKGDK